MSRLRTRVASDLSKVITPDEGGYERVSYPVRSGIAKEYFRMTIPPPFVE